MYACNVGGGGGGEAEGRDRYLTNLSTSHLGLESYGEILHFSPGFRDVGRFSTSHLGLESYGEILHFSPGFRDVGRF